VGPLPKGREGKGREGKGPTYLRVPSSTGPLGGTRKWAPPPREGSHLNVMPIKDTDTGALKVLERYLNGLLL